MNPIAKKKVHFIIFLIALVFLRCGGMVTAMNVVGVTNGSSAAIVFGPVISNLVSHSQDDANDNSNDEPSNSGGCGLSSEMQKTDFKVTADSKYLFYRSGQDEWFGVVSNQKLVRLNLSDSSEKILWHINNDIEAIDYKISPNEKFVIIKGDLKEEGVNQLYRVDIDGGEPVLLSQNRKPDLNIDDYVISPDSKFVVFSGDAEVDSLIQLYSVSVEGGSVTLLSDNTDPRLGVDDFKVSPDSSTVVFKGNIDEFLKTRLYSVPLSGGDIQVVSHELATDDYFSISDYQISADSKYLVYNGIDTIHDISSVYAVVLSSNKNILLTSNTNSTSIDGHFELSLDSQYVVYQGVLNADSVVRLYSMTIDGANPPITLSNNTASDKNLNVASFKITPDSKEVVFLGDPLKNNADRLFSVLITGGDVVDLLSDIEVEGSDVEKLKGIQEYVVTADSKGIVFSGDVENAGVVRLYHVLVNGQQLQVLSQNTTNDSKLDVKNFVVSNNSQCVVFDGYLENKSDFNMYSRSLKSASIQSLEKLDTKTEDYDPATALFIITPDSKKGVVQLLENIKYFDVCTE